MPSLRDPSVRAGGVLGVGLGGLADGVVLHQVLQWHHLVSARTSASTLGGLERNTLIDGVFHLVAIAILLVGIVLLARSARAADVGWTRRVVGGALIGWGAFHLVDEVLFHVVLDLHHIRMVDDYLVYDAGFTAIGVALFAGGVLILRSAEASDR